MTSTAIYTAKYAAIPMKLNEDELRLAMDALRFKLDTAPVELRRCMSDDWDLHAKFSKALRDLLSYKQEITK